MSDHSPRTAPARSELPADEPRLAALVWDLRRILAAASPEDRAFVLGRLEALARRFHGQGRTSP